MSGPTDVRKDQASAAGDKTSAANAAKTKKPMPFKRTYFGLGLWNVYFICKFALAYAGYLRLDLLLNAVFFLFVLIPVTGKWLNGLRQVAAIVLGIALLWSESWLPGPESIIANTSCIDGF